MTQIYNNISIAAFSLAGITFVFAMFCWFKFKIWEIIGDLSGRTAKKSIAQMRAENEKSGNKKHGPTPRAKQRGPITEMIKIKKGTDNAEGTEVLTEETGLLGGETMVLAEETGLLGGVTELCPTETERLDKRQKQLIKLELIQNIVLVHTEENI